MKASVIAAYCALSLWAADDRAAQLKEVDQMATTIAGLTGWQPKRPLRVEVLSREGLQRFVESACASR